MIATEEEARAYVAARCDARAFAALERLAERLRAENERQNLVAATTLERVWTRHIADSAQLLDFVTPRPGLRWLDLGTGAGFPGLVIALMRPDFAMVLVEARKLRGDWLRACLAEAGAGQARVAVQRIETVEVFPADVISARAFAPLPKLVKLARRFSTNQTTWLLPKGRSAAQEVAALAPSERKMFHVEQSLTDPDAGIVVGGGTRRVDR
ncbi:MAG: 16S rRNA (guanine(527)-N(7))-methyltransferase RsmG [Cypionkella sp.]